jgi:hypothetical protein
MAQSQAQANSGAGRLKDRIALITSSSSGIGRGIAIASRRMASHPHPHVMLRIANSTTSMSLRLPPSLRWRGVPRIRSQWFSGPLQLRRSADRETKISRKWPLPFEQPGPAVRIYLAPPFSPSCSALF